MRIKMILNGNLFFFKQKPQRLINVGKPKKKRQFF